MSTVPVRVPGRVQIESARLAALRGKTTGEVLAEAWAEYLKNHRDEFAADLEEAARIVRDGTTNDLAKFLAGDAEELAMADAERIRS